MGAHATETTELIIEGADCPVCLNATLDALRGLPGVAEVHLSATDHCLRIEHDGIEPERLVDLARTGLHGVAKYGTELVMVEVDPEQAELHCTHR